MNDRATERLLELQDHLIAAIDLLTEEITNAPNTATACLRAGYLSDIYRISQRIAEEEWPL